MPRPTRLPKYRHYKPKNLAVVRIDGKDHYLGKYDSPESREKYHRLISSWLAENSLPSRPPITSPLALNINQVILKYHSFASGYYLRDGKASKELTCMKDALRPLRKLYGSSPASEFGPLDLKIVRNHMISEQDLCRNEINKRIGRIKRFFKWAVSEELVPPSILQGLQTVTGLRKGRTSARESPPVKPVPDQWVEATFPFLPPQLIAMIEVQRHTGMRPGEVVVMRASDLDMSEEVWIYQLDRHKNDWRDLPRFIAIGPKAQAFIQPFLNRQVDEYLFSPEEAYRWRLEHRAASQRGDRKTPIYPSELRAREKAKEKRRKRKSRRRKGSKYSTNSYWKALSYAFIKAEKEGVKLHRWHPNQLRHTRGTELRKKFGVEASRVSLGHARLDATEIYAEKDLKLAIQIAREAG
ncbi:Site-specific tyrosine recombinase XerC [Planctomycetales bacterium 10988]|nr:Site-specific tyrosine recombinase XerC [Planctomycetales bacterium 10988]